MTRLGKQNVYIGSTVADAFAEAMYRWRRQRDSDPSRLDAPELVEQVFAKHGLVLVPAADAARVSGLLAVVNNAERDGLTVHVATRVTCAEHLAHGDDKATEPLTAAAFRQQDGEALNYKRVTYALDVAWVASNDVHDLPRPPDLATHLWEALAHPAPEEKP